MILRINDEIYHVDLLLVESGPIFVRLELACSERAYCKNLLGPKLGSCPFILLPWLCHQVYDPCHRAGSGYPSLPGSACLCGYDVTSPSISASLGEDLTSGNFAAESPTSPPWR